jgi:catechol 2,3-dioxygenase-like lactoylglutathione lyase family enzyme
MEPESFFHVAVKTDDLAASEAFYREQFGGQVVDRGEAAGGSGVEFLMEPTTFGDLKLAFLTDTSGVRIELIEHLQPGGGSGRERSATAHYRPGRASPRHDR